nr:DUF3304 domain-containing protein [Pseudomonas protegens]
MGNGQSAHILTLGESVWQNIKNYSRHKATVEIPRCDIPGVLKVHFLPCDQVRVTAAGTSPGYPGYPYNYPMEMEEPEVCQS